MGTVLGLSLTAGAVGWALVDASQGTVLDHDAIEFAADVEIAGTAARGAYAIATTAGLEVDRVRMTWSDDAKHSGLRLRTKLRSLGLADVEAVPQVNAVAAAGEPERADIPARITLAYGAAMATVDPSEAITEPVRRQPSRRSRGRQLASAAAGLTAATALSVVCLGAGSAPQVAPAPTTTEQAGSQDPGWVAVPAAPPNVAATTDRKVVVPSATAEPAIVVVQRYDPAPAFSAPELEAPVAAPQPVAEPPVQAHLTGVTPALPAGVVGPSATAGAAPAPGPGFTEPAPPSPPGDQMTDPFNLFTPLP